MKNKRSMKEFFKNNFISLIVVVSIICLGAVLAGDVIVKEGAMSIDNGLNVYGNAFINGNINATGNITASKLYFSSGPYNASISQSAGGLFDTDFSPNDGVRIRNSAGDGAALQVWGANTSTAYKGNIYFDYGSNVRDINSEVNYRYFSYSGGSVTVLTLNSAKNAIFTGTVKANGFNSSDGSGGITNTTGYLMCIHLTSNVCDTWCTAQIKNGLITGCT